MDTQDIQSRLAAVRISYIESLKDKHNAIAHLWPALCQQWKHDDYEALHLIIHGLAGSAETFGLPQLTQLARHAVDGIREHNRSDNIKTVQEQLDSRINAVLAELKAVLHKEKIPL